MKRSVESWSVERLSRERGGISFPEYQREKALWPVEKKRLLIDSLLIDIDIPKLYFNRVEKDQYEVIDGQQRLWAIWEFLDDEYTYKADNKATLFSKLPVTQRRTIENYQLQITVFEKAEEDYLRELFVRLQLGLLLNTGEKLNAEVGKMKDLVFKDLVAQKFIANIGMPVRRFAKQTLCAQIAINSFSLQKTSSFARTRYDDLLHFFSEYAAPQGKDLALFKEASAQIVAVLTWLWGCFGAEARDLKNRSYILSLYLFVEELAVKKKELSGKDEQKVFREFVFKLIEAIVSFTLFRQC